LSKRASPAQVERLLDAFFRQKEERFRELGIPDPFRDPGVRGFIRKAALDRLEEGCPAIELYGLTVGTKVVAVLGGAADKDRLSGMFISFEACKEAMKFSPGDILVSRIVREQCLRGRRYFDLGVGEARYKSTFCNDTVELVDAFLPVSSKGRVYASARRALASLKRHVKQKPARHAARCAAAPRNRRRLNDQAAWLPSCGAACSRATITSEAPASCASS
jgi:CelD/BcsL family acetyltransferase involved in cellulose biosynthesis